LWLVVAIVAAVVIWRVGEAHKTACVNAGNVNCSLLPWSGSSPGSSGAGGGLQIQSPSSGASDLGGSVGGSLSGSGHSLP
jgi:hypothetical protein